MAVEEAGAVGDDLRVHLLPQMRRAHGGRGEACAVGGELGEIVAALALICKGSSARR